MDKTVYAMIYIKCTAYKYLNCNQLVSNMEKHPEADATFK